MNFDLHDLHGSFALGEEQQLMTDFCRPAHSFLVELLDDQDLSYFRSLSITSLWFHV